jgi:SAM-dependent methyltransferase
MPNCVFQMHPTPAMAKFVVEYGKDSDPPAADGRLDGPSFHRNHEPIWSAISEFLLAQTGDVLEIGSGTGQHVTEFARRSPRLTWWPSDIYDSHLKSITAWRTHSGLENLRAPQRIDLTDPDWTWTAAGGGSRGPLTALLCINVLHISPWSVSRNLMSGAGRLLKERGRLFIYGPFKRGGAHTAPSNAQFDATLRTENPEWGVRDVDDLNALAQDTGLTMAEISPMPANNLVLAFTRLFRQNRSNDAKERTHGS